LKKACTVWEEVNTIILYYNLLQPIYL